MTRFKTYPIETRRLVALAFAAQRANGALYKDPEIYDEAAGGFKKVVPNKVLMRDSFAFEPGSNPELVPSEQDFEQADLAMAAIQQDVMVRQLGNKRVNDFLYSLCTTISEDSCSSKDCGIVAFVPQTYERMLATQAKQEAIATISSGSEYLGKVGDKVKLDFTLIDFRYLQQYNCYSVNGHDSQGNLVNFLTAHKELAVNGRIQGRVKRTEESRFHNGARVTQLNFVKVA
jgi:hypothetical protein